MEIFYVPPRQRTLRVLSQSLKKRLVKHISPILRRKSGIYGNGLLDAIRILPNKVHPIAVRLVWLWYLAIGENVLV